jgi:hypothetical protein
MLKAFGNHAQREGLNLGDGLTAVSAVAEHAGQCRHLCDPATVVFAFKLNREGHRITLHPGWLPNKRVKPVATGSCGIRAVGRRGLRASRCNRLGEGSPVRPRVAPDGRRCSHERPRVNASVDMAVTTR